MNKKCMKIVGSNTPGKIILKTPATAESNAIPDMPQTRGSSSKRMTGSTSPTKQTGGKQGMRVKVRDERAATNGQEAIGLMIRMNGKDNPRVTCMKHFGINMDPTRSAHGSNIVVTGIAGTILKTHQKTYYGRAIPGTSVSKAQKMNVGASTMTISGSNRTSAGECSAGINHKDGRLTQCMNPMIHGKTHMNSGGNKTRTQKKIVGTGSAKVRENRMATMTGMKLATKSTNHGRPHCPLGKVVLGMTVTLAKKKLHGIDGQRNPQRKTGSGSTRRRNRHSGAATEGMNGM